MLIPLNPFHSPAPLAYRVPWVVDRSDESHPVIINMSAEPADFVRVLRDDLAADADMLHGSVEPGRSFSVCLCDADLDTVTVTVCWFRGGTDDEFTWRFVV